MYQISCDRCNALLDKDCISLSSVKIKNNKPQTRGWEPIRHYCFKCYGKVKLLLPTGG